MTILPESAERPERLFVGVDVGKAHHWVCAVNQEGVPFTDGTEACFVGRVCAVNQEGVPFTGSALSTKKASVCCR